MRPDDRGVAFVEFAVVFPVLSLLLLGAVEFGYRWRTSLDVSAAVGLAARAASNTMAGGGDDPLADQVALAALLSALDDDPVLVVDRVVIFRADGPRPPAVCLDLDVVGGTGGIDGLCNVYSGAWLRETFDPDSSTAFAPGEGCGAGVDAAYCPEHRQVAGRRGVDADLVGLWVAVDRPSTVGLFGGSYRITDRQSHRLEPGAGILGGGDDDG